MTKHWLLYFSILIGAFGIAIAIQHHLFLHGDVAYLLDVAETMLKGGTYGHDFFETNPPMILYLYLPPLLLSKATGLSLTLSLQSYIFALAALSTTLSFHLLKKLIAEPVALYFFTLCLLFVLLFLPAHNFGQREHLFLILATPYFFAAAVTLENKPLSLHLSVLIGLLAGIGFCIKPFFLFPLIFIELAIIYNKKYLFGFIRTESIIIASILIIYLATTRYYFPSYFQIMLPLINHFYFPGIKQSWLAILTNVIVMFCLLTCATTMILRKKTCRHPLLTVLELATLGAILSFLVTRTCWFVHLLPAFGLATLLVAFLLTTSSATAAKQSRHIVCLISAILLFFPIASTVMITRHSLYVQNYITPQPLIQFFAKQPSPASFMCFSATTPEDCFPLITELHGQHGNRQPFFWWLRGMRLSNTQTPDRYLNAYMALQYFIDLIADDLNHLKPHWIIINLADAKRTFDAKFDYIDFLSQNEHFKSAWHQYRYATTLGCYRIYERRT